MTMATYLFVKEGNKTRKSICCHSSVRFIPKRQCRRIRFFFHAFGSITTADKKLGISDLYFYYPYEEGLKKVQSADPVVVVFK